MVRGNLKFTAWWARRGCGNGGQRPHSQTVGLRAETLASGMEDYCYSYLGIMSNPARENLHLGQCWVAPCAPVPVQVSKVHRVGV